MTDLAWYCLAKKKYDEQNCVCGICGKSLYLFEWPRPQLAHKIKRGKVVAELGKEYEWHPDLLTLVCPNTRKGKSCNDAALIGAAHPVEEQALIKKILEGK